ncbi:hypothetical protein PVAND_008657 [Polypedilum vanderplanki]|uniref:Ankyrin repeat protein n=1 Tax=Polypedilum vanderplanki TaxID=319348 RepID=A0A9J6CAA7_POLVA|nr:hypothetical protein PVAND_008657 [Polypedilum vanderplanki]
MLPQFGIQFLHATIRKSPTKKALTPLLSFPQKIDLNIFFQGFNAYLLLLNQFTGILHYKPIHEKIMVLQMLLDYCDIKDINVKDTYGNSYFMYIIALHPDQNYIDNLMLNNKKDFHEVNNQNNTCLHFASMNIKNNEIIRILLSHGIDSNMLNNENELAIHIAIRFNFNAIKILLPLLTCDDLKQKYTLNKECLIQTAAKYGNEETFKLFLDFYLEKNVQIDVNEFNGNGENLLMVSTQFEITEMIIEKFSESIEWSKSNKKEETIFHKDSFLYFLVMKDEILLKFPIIKENLNKNLMSDKGEAIMEILAHSYYSEHESKLVQFFLSHVDIENIKNYFYKITKNYTLMNELLKINPFLLDEIDSSKLYFVFETCIEEPEKFLILLKNISHEKLLKVQSNGKGNNLLHLICDQNNKWLLDTIIKFINNEESINKLTGQKNQLQLTHMNY